LFPAGSREVGHAEAPSAPRNAVMKGFPPSTGSVSRREKEPRGGGVAGQSRHPMALLPRVRA
jgi:hypothetical protein